MIFGQIDIITQENAVQREVQVCGQRNKPEQKDVMIVRMEIR